MDPALRMKLAPERRLAMTFALRQALEILQMPQIELGAWLSQEIVKNPLLEETSSPKGGFPLSEEIAAPISLFDHLSAQIRERVPSKENQKIAWNLMEHLDEKGFLSTPLEEIASALNIPPEEIRTVLRILQTFDPPGIFATDLKESLLLQLKAKGDLSGTILIQKYYQDLVHGRFTVIERKMKQVNLTETIQKLASLNFRPAEVFRQEVVPTKVADLRFSKTEKGWTIETCEEEMPQFHLVTEYESISASSPEERETLRSWTASAKWLFRSLKRRRRILLDLGTFLIKIQGDYLSQKGPLKPLSLQELSAKLQIHESTLSRAISDKYVETPRGILSLRSLVSSSLETNRAIQVLRELVQQEDLSNPLSDEQLSIELRKKGHPIARRTVAKYRSQLNIASASVRKYRSPKLF